jgi:translation machinery-associated protein 16
MCHLAQSIILTQCPYTLADRYAFFFHALPPDVPSLSLPEVHDIIQSVWLTRHDGALEAERASRRPGRPPSARELALLEMKRQDEEVYRTGLSESPRMACA